MVNTSFKIQFNRSRFYELCDKKGMPFTKALLLSGNHSESWGRIQSGKQKNFNVEGLYNLSKVLECRMEDLLIATYN